MSAPNWHATARLLAEHPKCPEGLVMYTVSGAWACTNCSETTRGKGGPPWHCWGCGSSNTPRKTVDAVSIPDLSDSPAGLANVGPLLMALPVHWRLCHLEDGWGVNKDPRHRRSTREEVVYLADSPPHALALALLEVHQ